MLRIFKLIVSTTLFSFTLSSNIEIMQSKVTWIEAVARCNHTGSRISSKADILAEDQDKQLCKNEIQNTYFWIGNNDRLSNIIEVEGCFSSSLLDSLSISKNGHHSLLDCYLLCSTGSHAVFAHIHFSGGPNCKCNFTGVNISELGESKQSSQCFNSERSLWWKYKIHKNEFQFGIESCQQISCTNGNSAKKIFRNILCGPRDNDKTPDGDLLYICTTNTKNDTTTVMGLPWKFSFIYNASIETDSDQSKSIVAECKAIACVNGKTYETLTKNCTSETLGFMCLNETGTTLHFNNTPLTTSVSPINIAINSSEQPVNNSSHTNARKMSTESSTSKEKNTYAASTSKPVHDASTSAYTKSPEQITNPGAPDIKSPMTHISSNSNSHVTRSRKENIFHSTSHEVFNQNANGNSPKGLLVGVLVTALVIVVIVVLLVVCRLKRKGLFRNKKYGGDSHIAKFYSPRYPEKDVIYNKKTHTVQNSTYDMHALSENENEFSLSVQDSNNLNNTTSSKYAVVMKNKQLICNTTNQQQSKKEENSDGAENENDGLNHNRLGSFNSNTKENNIYDSSLGFRDESDSTYVIESHVHVVDKDDNSVYDHM